MEKMCMDITVNSVNFCSKTKLVKKASIKKCIKSGVPYALSAGSLGVVSEMASNQLFSEDTRLIEDAQKSVKEKQRLQFELNLAEYRNRIKIQSDKKDALVKKTIIDAIGNEETLTLEQIAARTKLTKNEVLAAIYSRHNGIRELYDIVKDKRIENGIADSIRRAGNAINKAVRQNTIYPEISDAEEDYKLYLAKKLRTLQLNDAVEKTLLDGFSKSPVFADELISTTNKSGQTRFNIGEMCRTKYINDLFDNYQDNPELTSKLTFEQTDEGDFKYSLHQILRILNAAKISPKLVEPMIEQPELVSFLIDETDIEGNPRFGINEIVEMSKLNKQVPKFLNILIDSIDIKEEPRFTGSQICYIINQYFQKPDLVMSLIKTKHFGETIEHLLKTYDSDDKDKIKLADEILYEKDFNPYSNLEELKMYDIRKEINTIIEKYKDKEFLPDEVINELRKNYGYSPMEFLDTLGSAGYTKKEILDILKITKTEFSLNDYYHLKQRCKFYPHANIWYDDIFPSKTYNI